MDREGKKLPFFADNMLVYRESPKESTKKKIVELINGVAMHKMQKSIVFLYTSNKIKWNENQQLK